MNKQKNDIIQQYNEHITLVCYLLVVATMKSHVSIECREIPKPTATQVTAMRQLGPAATTA